MIDSMLIQLGYSVNEGTINQMKAVLSKCDLDEKELKHVLELNEKIKPLKGYVAMSNSNEFLKIKNEANSDELTASVREIILEWAQRYKINLQKVEGKETFYIIGRMR